MANPPKAEFRSANNALEPTAGVATGVTTLVVGAVTGFGAYSFKIEFFKSSREGAGVVVDANVNFVVEGNCGADFVRTGESNSRPRRD
jgi:hypothetical protein